MNTEIIFDEGNLTVMKVIEQGAMGMMVTYHWIEHIEQNEQGPFNSVEAALRAYYLMKQEHVKEAKAKIERFVTQYDHLLHVRKEPINTVIQMDFKNKRRRLTGEID
jgi:hypothetical protein